MACTASKSGAVSLVHAELGEVGEAEQAGLLGAEPDHVLDQVQHVEAATAAAAADRGLVEPPPHPPVLQGGQRGLVAGLDQREQELAVVPRGARGFGGAGDVVRGRPASSPASSSSSDADFMPSLTRWPNSVPEGGQLGVDGLEPFLPAASSWMPVWRNSLRYSSTSRSDSASSRSVLMAAKRSEQPPVQVHGILVGREAGGEPGLELTDGVRGVRGDQREERRRGTLQQLTGAFHRQRSVLEGRRLRVRHDGLDSRPDARRGRPRRPRSSAGPRCPAIGVRTAGCWGSRGDLVMKQLFHA